MILIVALMIRNLLHVWDDSLGKDEFCLGMFLIDECLAGEDLVASGDLLRAAIQI